MRTTAMPTGPAFGRPDDKHRIVRKWRPGWSRRAQLALRCSKHGFRCGSPTRPAQMKNLGIADAKHRRFIQERRPKAAFAPSPPQAGGGTGDVTPARFTCNRPGTRPGGTSTGLWTIGGRQVGNQWRQWRAGFSHLSVIAGSGQPGAPAFSV
jgi:hypothetical protein